MKGQLLKAVFSFANKRRIDAVATDPSFRLLIFIALSVFLSFHGNGEIIFLAFADDDESAVRIRMGGDGRFRIFDLHTVYADSAVGDIFSCLAF